MSRLEPIAISVIALLCILSLSDEMSFAADPQDIPIPVFDKSTQTFSPTVTFHFDLADLNGDGFLDVVFANMAAPSQVLFNNGNGVFLASGQSFPSGMHGAACGDVDSDGDVDIFFAANSSTYGSSPIYLNNGSGYFTKSSIDIGDMYMSGLRIQLEDIENDGDLDASIEYAGASRAIYINDGSGTFVNSGTGYTEVSSLHDLNSDSFIDLLGRELGSGFRTYTNDQEGNLNSSSFFSKIDLIRGECAFADLDSDGDPDAIYTNGEGTTYPAGVLLNDGTGSFSESGQILSSVNVSRIGTGDLNRDGHIDIVFTDWDNPAQIWLNDGTGQLFDSGVRLSGDGFWTWCEVVDVDNDGDLDIFIANCGSYGNTLWLNNTPVDPCCGQYSGLIAGNANCSEDGKLTLSDVTRLIDYVYISKSPMCCHANGNTNGSADCSITLSDITRLIDAVYISKSPPATCMSECET